MDNPINEKLEDYLKFYLELSNPQFAVLINGRWGSGKTFFIKNKIQKWNSEPKQEKDNSTTKKTCFLSRKNKSIDEKVFLKPIYISLYGVSNTKQINDKIKEALNPLLYSKGAKIMKNVLLGAVKTVSHINLDIDGNGKSDGKISFDINSLGLLKGVNDKIKGNKLIIFDDLERCKLKISELFGYINEFVEHFNCKVILLSEEIKMEEKCKEDNDSYKDFKEKLIGQTFTIHADIEKAIEAFINNSTQSKENELLITSKELIKTVFEASKVENLRILKQSIIDFNRFISQFESNITDHKEYNNFLNSLLGHFILVYLEYKSGNNSINNITKFCLKEEEKKEEEKIRIKYGEELNKFKIYPRMSVIQYYFIIDFINNGYSDTVSLNKSISENVFFRDLKEQDWEKLWRWEMLEDNEFEEAYNNVLKSLINNNIKNPYILLHVVTILLSLIKKEIVEPLEINLVEKFKEIIDSILRNNQTTPYVMFREYACNKSYRELESDEFAEMIKYANDKIIIHNSKNKDDYLKKIFENINDENISQLQDQLNAPLPDSRSIYSYLPILM